jgi:hypothetical protein
MIRTVLLIVLVSSVACYFDYSNCKQECRNTKLSCTISEQSPNYFPCECIDMELSCLHLSSRDVVCLRKDKPPVGGEAIWEAFDRHIHPTTTTAPNPPQPAPGPNSEKWFKLMFVYSTISTSIFAVIGILKLIKFLKRRREASYARMPSPPNDTVDGPYFPTNQPVQE